MSRVERDREDALVSGDLGALRQLVAAHGSGYLTQLGPTGSSALVSVIQSSGGSRPRARRGGQKGGPRATVPQVVQFLLKAGCGPNEQDGCGCWPLVEACRRACELRRETWPANVAIMLLDAGARVDVCGEDGKTALYWLCSLYEPKLASWPSIGACVQRLVSRGADVNAKETTSQRTPVHAAAIAMTKHEDRAMLFEDDGSEEDVGAAPRRRRGGMASRWPPPLNVLLSNGGEVDARDVQGMTPMLVAVGCMSVSAAMGAVTLLAEAGADMNASDKRGRRALEIAGDPESTLSHSGANVKVLEALFRAGCDPNHTDAHHTYTPFAGVCGCESYTGHRGKLLARVVDRRAPTVEVLRAFLMVGGDVMHADAGAPSVASIAKAWASAEATPARRLIEYMARAQQDAHEELALIVAKPVGGNDEQTSRTELDEGATPRLEAAVQALGAAVDKAGILAALTRVARAVASLDVVPMPHVQQLIDTAMQQRLKRATAWDADVAVRFGACVRAARASASRQPSRPRPSASHTAAGASGGADGGGPGAGAGAGAGAGGAGAGAGAGVADASLQADGDDHDAATKFHTKPHTAGGAGPALVKQSTPRPTAPPAPRQSFVAGNNRAWQTAQVDAGAKPGVASGSRTCPSSVEGWLVKRGDRFKVRGLLWTRARCGCLCHNNGPVYK